MQRSFIDGRFVPRALCHSCPSHRQQRSRGASPSRRIAALVAAGLGALASHPAIGGIAFLSQHRAAEMIPVPAQPDCAQLVASTAPGLFSIVYQSGCDGALSRVQQNTFIVPSSFVAGTGHALDVAAISIEAVRSSLECRFVVDCAATITFGGLLQASGDPVSRSSLRVLRACDDASETLFLREAVATGQGDVFTSLDAVVALGAGTYCLRVEAYAATIDLPGPNISFTAFDFSALFATGNSLCAADLNGDGAVDGADLGLLLRAWKSALDGCDISGDGAVGSDDLDLLLSAWGDCPAVLGSRS
ncbi:MAG TPA: hypothetical protein PKC43_05920 [Phycisphaerales bacterium]|nr:hypothetical protein [Phycisphaerales bacterium]HMP36970.1 hypothetical protein [Phycisphaerales bacterium]